MGLLFLLSKFIGCVLGGVVAFITFVAKGNRMNWDTYIFIAFCVFMFMVGMRLKQRFGKKKQEEPEIKVRKNQRAKMTAISTEEPPLVRERRLRRERRTRFFTIVQLFVLFGLMIFMAPALVKDLMLPESIDVPNFFLRCLIFVFTIYVFILGYLKVFRRKREESQK